MEYLYVVVDYGSSALKVVFGTKLIENPKYFMMQPEVIEVPVEAIAQYRQIFGADPARHSFIGIEDRYYAVGELAQQVFRSTLNLAEPKSNYAVHRTLAAISVAARLARIQVGKKFKLFLCCLLPPGELRDRDLLEQSLRKALQKFESPMGQLHINLLYFNCHPEGGGLSLFTSNIAGI